jgi:hypothetical protein
MTESCEIRIDVYD